MLFKCFVFAGLPAVWGICVDQMLLLLLIRPTRASWRAMSINVVKCVRKCVHQYKTEVYDHLYQDPLLAC